MSGEIFLIQGKDQLIKMKEELFDSETFFQELLARYPSLLAGDQIDSNAPRKWLLISREVGVPDAEEGAGRWSIDHLFLDQDGIPTLVEVKRSSDTRIRREVVGQMLDYAANAVVYWPVETIRAQFEAHCQTEDCNPEQEIKKAFGDDTNVDQLWQNVKTNLQAKKIRLVFVADEIPAELCRIIEFLNEQMDPTEVLGVEIKQYVGKELRTLVPRVVGQTAEAQQKKSGGSREMRQWNEVSFLEELTKQYPDGVEVARAVLQWAKTNTQRISWGTGSQTGSLSPLIEHNGRKHKLVAIWPYGTMEIPFEYMMNKPPFSDREKRLELVRRLNRACGGLIPEEKVDKRPNIPLSAFKDMEVLKHFLGVLEWAIKEIRAS
ncbi:MAG: hypothetical protein NTY01_13585 [Verrucomicrobia bacterium]|nr:hypothetical protein [Verrucomicrobiota bacterium]